MVDRSMTVAEKMMCIREEEMLNKRQASEIMGIPYSTLLKYETGKAMPSSDVLMRILQLPQFTKYALWVMTDLTAPEAGQVAPSDYVLRKVSKVENDGKKTG